MYAVAQITLMLLPIFRYELLEDFQKNVFLTIDLGKENLYNILSIYGSNHDEKISYDEFIDAYENALLINAEAEALGFQSLCMESKSFPQKLKSSKDPGILLYIPYIKGNSECLDTKIVSIYGSKILSEYAKLSSERIGRRIAENNLTLVTDLDMTCDLLGMEGCLNSNGKIIGLLKGEYKESISKIQRILEKGGCILSLMPPTMEFKDMDINPFKISLSDANIIIEMGNDVPLLDMQIQKKVPYCLSFPEKYSNKFTERIINGGLAIRIQNHADVICLANKLVSEYTSFDNCIIYCFRSSKINRYFDKIWILTYDVPQYSLIDHSKQYDITQVELVINNENTIIEVIDHTKKRIYHPFKECKIKIDNFNKYSVLYDVKNHFYNCDFSINYHTRNVLTIYIEPIFQKESFMYKIQSDILEDDHIDIQMNDRHELVCIFDKVKEIYFFPAKDQMILGFYEGNAYKFKQVYFNSDINLSGGDIQICPRPPLDYDRVHYYNLEEVIIKYEGFRVFVKKTQAVFYSNGITNGKIHDSVWADYNQFVVNNLIEQENSEERQIFNMGLKLYIKNNLTDMLKGKVSEVNVNNLKRNIHSRLPQNAVLMDLDEVRQELAVECKFEIICSLIDEIIDVGGDEILKINLTLIDECIDDNSRCIFEVEDLQDEL